MEPSLSPEEWATRFEGGQGDRHWSLKRKHQTAALCLYGQPFGFTWEDVDGLRRLADAEDMTYEATGSAFCNPVWVYDLANRIAALLPPREETPGG